MRNLAAANNFLATISTNGKEEIKTLDNMFEHYFETKHELHEITNALDRYNGNDDVLVLELHGFKFAYAMRNKN